MLKYFQRFPFIETNKYLFKAFTEEEFDTKGWVQNLKSLLDRLGLSNLGQNKEQHKRANISFLRNMQHIYFYKFYTVS